MAPGPDLTVALTRIREQLSELYDVAPTPALAVVLRTMVELAIEAEGYADPSAATVVPPHYVGPV